ncbi:PA2169 family four-helix-bundle protein [Stratiformator vulcanicus]|uniref:DUF2383 domain-containing protein n=1 Tax=Stratiformator vulcanicus TaxID=2527980 RepID=A0A517QZ11_9PLAN|nr:PA2169 family four-helix-bundle protein [Stratiformator vulcanicus]QDT36838.1 hypothetical protein Pan189_12010 [Stratiformator vulcanicus]
MNAHTQTELSDNAVEQLQDLIQINIDSADGFRHSAEQIENVTISQYFRGVADERKQQAEQLQGFVEFSGERPRQEGSYLASLHRTIMDLRTALTSDDLGAVLNEAERGEDYIKDAYKDTLKETAGSPVNDVLQNHMESVIASHDRVRDMRDEVNS